MRGNDGDGGHAAQWTCHRGVARYFFFRSILMKRHFDTFASEVWAKYTSEEKFAKKCIKLKV